MKGLEVEIPVLSRGKFKESTTFLFHSRRSIDIIICVSDSEYHWLFNECAKWLQSCLTLCDYMDSSLPGSSVHGILQARILKWVAMSFSILMNIWLMKTMYLYIKFISFWLWNTFFLSVKYAPSTLLRVMIYQWTKRTEILDYYEYYGRNIM